jgi:hypothetical protein
MVTALLIALSKRLTSGLDSFLILTVYVPHRNPSGCYFRSKDCLLTMEWKCDWKQQKWAKM